MEKGSRKYFKQLFEVASGVIVSVKHFQVVIIALKLP